MHVTTTSLGRMHIRFVTQAGQTAAYHHHHGLLPNYIDPNVISGLLMLTYIRSLYSFIIIHSLRNYDNVEAIHTLQYNIKTKQKQFQFKIQF
jgi:hypothetical protein